MEKRTGALSKSSGRHRRWHIVGSALAAYQANLLCRECGAVGMRNVEPNWQDRV